jgi:hypothetical protein
MSADELPMYCRACAHKQSQYLYPAWTHRCTKAKPMVEGCRWKTPRTHSEVRNERKFY